MTDQDHLDRINALTHNARQTWFALLGALVFVGITLMGVEHIDFYGVDRATKLPLVSVEVPTRLFFIAAPVLTAAIFGYFHLYLIRLWDALGAAPSHIKGRTLGDAIHPWLVSDAALHLRARIRGDNSATPRALEDASMLLNLLFAWVFGISALGLLWLLSMPARSFPMTALAGASLLVSVFAGGASFSAMWVRLSRVEQPRYSNVFNTAPAMAVMIACIPFVFFFSLERTTGSSNRLEPVVLVGENIVLRPPGWLGYTDARAEFRAQWCAREQIVNCADMEDRTTEFDEEFVRRRQAALAELRRPHWHKPSFSASGMDFRRADLSKSFLTGVNLIEAKMDGVSLFNAEIEGAFLDDADMGDAVLMAAQMEGAFLSRAELQRADLSWARMEGAALRGAKMHSALLFGARLVSVNIDEAHLENARFDYSRLSGKPSAPVTFKDTNLSNSANEGGMLRFADLSQARYDAETDFRNTFLDRSVTMTDEFRLQMGHPCQWADEELSDSEFYGRWRGWVEAAPYEFEFPIWKLLAPEGFADVPAIAPQQGCAWSIGAMPKPLDLVSLSGKNN